MIKMAIIRDPHLFVQMESQRRALLQHAFQHPLEVAAEVLWRSIVGMLEVLAPNIYEQPALRFDLPPDETLGSGALQSILRSLSGLRQTSAALTNICPDAWVLNLTNPLRGGGREPRSTGYMVLRMATA
jgi:alpha-galactosidase/6-phospho-beta-glucosidase family protein